MNRFRQSLNYFYQKVKWIMSTKQRLKHLIKLRASHHFKCVKQTHSLSVSFRTKNHQVGFYSSFLPIPDGVNVVYWTSCWLSTCSRLYKPSTRFKNVATDNPPFYIFLFQNWFLAQSMADMNLKHVKLKQTI